MITRSALRHRSLIGLVTLVLTGCGTTHESMYAWGSYETQIYNLYSQTGKTPTEDQLASLERDREVARARHRPLPPGHHAHLGYLYFSLGRVDQAIAAFESEKTLYPESRRYMDRLIDRAKNKSLEARHE